MGKALTRFILRWVIATVIIEGARYAVYRMQGGEGILEAMRRRRSDEVVNAAEGTVDTVEGTVN